MASSGHPAPGQVGVGVAAIITNAEGKILVGKRKGGFGNGEPTSAFFLIIITNSVQR